MNCDNIIDNMKKDNQKLILFDIDGTLFDNQNREVPLSTIAALEELSKTTKLGIATGRAQFMLYSIEHILHLFDYFVLINGQYIKDKKKVIYEDPLNYHLIDKLFRKMENMGIAYGFEGSHDEAISKIDDKVIQSFDALGLNLPPINKEYYHHNKVYQAWTFSNPDEVEILSKLYPEFQFIRWMGVGYDILPITSSKGLGMKKLADYLNIDLADVIAFGDGDNDFEMIRDAGIGIAMGNATEKVKSIADYVTTNVNEDGIYNALKYYQLLK